MKNHIVEIALCLLLAACLLTLRFYALDADPTPLHYAGGNWHDGPGIVHSARNAALWGRFTFPDDQFNLMYVYPVNTLLTYWAFKSFGVNWRVARLPNALLGALTILLVAFLAYLQGGLWNAAYAALMMSASYTFYTQNRIATGETVLTFFLVLAVSFLCSAGRRARGVFVLSFLGGVSLGLAVTAKLSGVLTLPVIGAWLLGDWYHERGVGKARLRESFAARSAVGISLGFLLVGILVVGLWAAPNWQEIKFMHSRFGARFGLSWDYPQRLLFALGYGNNFHWRLPMTTLLAYGYVVVFAYQVVASKFQKYDRQDSLWWCWVVVGTGLVSLSDMPLRRFVFLMPGFVLLASRALTNNRLSLMQFKDAVISFVHGCGGWWRPLIVAVLVFLPLVLVLDLVGSAVTSLVFDPLGYNLALPYSGKRFGAVALAALVGFWSMRRYPGMLRRLGLALILVFQLGLLVPYVSHLSYTARDASRRLGELLPAGTKVSGAAAVHLSLENQIRGIYHHTRWRPGGMNYSGRFDPLNRDDVHYLLVRSDPSLAANAPGKIRRLLERDRPEIVERLVVQAHWDGRQGPWLGVLRDGRYYNEFVLLKKRKRGGSEGSQ